MQKQVEKKKYYVVRERAVPEVLLKVVEAKRLLESKRVATVQEAAERTGISRSSFYKGISRLDPAHNLNNNIYLRIVYDHFIIMNQNFLNRISRKIS